MLRILSYKGRMEEKLQLMERVAMAERLAQNFIRNPLTECWIWQGAKNMFGYGRITIDKRSFDVHRVAYSAFNAPFDCWLNVCHRCDIRDCINPDHLFLGTRCDNQQDMVKKGRSNPRYGEGHHAAKLSSQDISDIRALHGVMKQKEIAIKYGICQPHVSDIVNKRRRKRG